MNPESLDWRYWLNGDVLGEWSLVARLFIVSRTHATSSSCLSVDSTRGRFTVERRHCACVNKWVSEEVRRSQSERLKVGWMKATLFGFAWVRMHVHLCLRIGFFWPDSLHGQKCFSSSARPGRCPSIQPLMIQFNAAVNRSRYIASNDRIISELWIGKDVEGSGRSQIFGAVPEVVCRDWGTPRKTLVRIAGLLAGIWTWDLPNTKLEC
jgi:hypothetical protein